MPASRRAFGGLSGLGLFREDETVDVLGNGGDGAQGEDGVKPRSTMAASSVLNILMVAGLSQARSKSRSIVLANLSLAHIQQRELENAAAVLHLAIDCVEARDQP